MLSTPRRTGGHGRSPTGGGSTAVEVRGAPATSLETPATVREPGGGFRDARCARSSTNHSGPTAGRGARSTSDEPRDPGEVRECLTGFRDARCARSSTNHSGPTAGRGARSASDEPRDPAADRPAVRSPGFETLAALAPQPTTAGPPLVEVRGAPATSLETPRRRQARGPVTGFRDARWRSLLNQPQRAHRWSRCEERQRRASRPRRRQARGPVTGFRDARWRSLLNQPRRGAPGFETLAGARSSTNRGGPVTGFRDARCARSSTNGGRPIRPPGRTVR